MTHDVIAAVLWSALGVSAVCTLAGLLTRRWWLMAAAATISLLFGLAAILSIGIIVIAIALLQAVGAVIFYRASRRVSTS